MMKISCVLILAAAAAMVDVGHCGEYPYEYTTYDNAGWSEPNSVVATRRQQQQYQSPNPTLTRRQQQALGALINPGTAIAGAGTALGLAVTSVVNQQLNQRVDDTNSRIGSVENDVKKSKANIKTLTDDSCTKTTCDDLNDLIKSTADEACPLTKCTEIETNANDLCTKDTCTEICNKVNEIFNIGTLGDATDDAIATFEYSDSITGTDNTPNTINFQAGGSMAANAVGKAASADFPGALLADLDSLRFAVAAAISALDKKIDSIVSVTSLSC